MQPGAKDEFSSGPTVPTDYFTNIQATGKVVISIHKPPVLVLQQAVFEVRLEYGPMSSAEGSGTMNNAAALLKLGPIFRKQQQPCSITCPRRCSASS